MNQYKSCLVQVSRSHDTNRASTPSQEIKVAQAAFVYVCLLPDGDSGQTTMQVSSPMVPRSPGPLASLSEKKPGYCVLAGISSNALPAPEMFWGNSKSSGDMVLHQLCDSRGPSPHLLQVPS